MNTSTGCFRFVPALPISTIWRFWHPGGPFISLYGLQLSYQSSLRQMRCLSARVPPKLSDGRPAFVILFSPSTLPVYLPGFDQNVCPQCASAIQWNQSHSQLTLCTPGQNFLLPVLLALEDLQVDEKRSIRGCAERHSHAGSANLLVLCCSFSTIYQIQNPLETTACASFAEKDSIIQISEYPIWTPKQLVSVSHACNSPR